MIEMMKKALVVDLDGTLCNNNHRLHHLYKFDESKKEKFDFNLAYSGIPKDDINNWCLELMNLYHQTGYSIIIMTGRHNWDKVKINTSIWLDKFKVPYDELYFRQDDELVNSDMKRAYYEQYIKDRYDIVLAIDDEIKVVEMWRSLGIPCLQC